MNIAMFTDSYIPYISGVVRSIQRFSRGLMALGHNVYIFAPRYKQNVLSDGEKDATQVFRFYSLPAPTCPAYALPIPISLRADKLMRSLKIDIIHTHSPFLTGKLGEVLARRHDIPLIFTHHTLYQEYSHYVPLPQKFTKQIITGYLRQYLRSCDHIIAPTEMIRKYVGDLYKVNHHISVIPSGIDVTAYQHADRQWLRNRWQIPADKTIILYLGRLSTEKNVRLIVEAFRLLKTQRPHLHLVLVGDGPDRNHLQHMIQTYKLEEDVTFTGAVPAEDAVKCYCGAQLFLFGSTTETQGLVLAEAMAAGLPVIAVEATGSSDIIINGHNGFLTENNAEALANHAETVLANPDLWHHMHENALATAQRYSIEATAQQLLDLYTQVIRENMQVS